MKFFASAIVAMILLNVTVIQAAEVKIYPIIGTRHPSLVTILTELESKLASGGSMDTTVTFLDNLRGSINEEQIRHDQLFTDQKGQCAVELELRTKDIKDAETILNRATEQMDNCQSSNLKTQAELDNNLSNQKTTEIDIDTLDTIRSNGAKLFDTKKQDLVDGLRSLEECVKILDAYQGGQASLVQVGSASMKLISDSVKFRKNSMMADISTVFLQLLSQDGGYAEIFEQLRQMLQTMEQDLYESLQKLQEDEDLAVSEYDERRTHLTDYLHNLRKTESELRNHSNVMEVCIEQQSAIIESARGKKVRNSELFDSAEHMCNDFEVEYDRATGVRRNEIEIVLQVKELIIRRINALSDE